MVIPASCPCCWPHDSFLPVTADAHELNKERVGGRVQVLGIKLDWEGEQGTCSCFLLAGRKGDLKLETRLQSAGVAVQL